MRQTSASRAFAIATRLFSPPQTSHLKVRTVPSALAVTMRPLDGSKVALVSLAEWPRRKNTSWPERASQSPAVVGPAVTTQRPSGLNSASLTTAK